MADPVKYAQVGFDDRSDPWGWRCSVDMRIAGLAFMRNDGTIWAPAAAVKAIYEADRG